MKKKVKRSRQRKRRTAARLKKEKWFDDLLFTHFQLEAFFERKRKDHLNNVFPPGGVTNTNVEVITPTISPDVTLTTTMSNVSNKT